VRNFTKLRLSWGLATVLSVALVSRPAGAADTAALAQSVVTGAVPIILMTAMDSGFSVQHCACMSEGCPPTYPWAQCAMVGLSLASMALGIAQALSAEDTKNAVQATDTGDYTATPGGGSSGGGLSSIPSIASECAKPNPPKYICTTDGLKDAKTDLNLLDNLTKTGQVVLTPEQQAGLDTAKSNIDKLLAGDTQGVLESDGNQFSDYASATAGRAGAATPKGIGNGDGSDGGTGGSVGWGGSTSGGLAGGGGGLGKTGPTGAYLDKTDWNGQLDMINPNTGKSLTIWERATRRYMGTPDGQRGYTMARIESLRKKSTQTIAAEAEKPAKKAVAKQEEPRTYVPVVMSPKEFSKH
jgi:hypothetical protein